MDWFTWFVLLIGMGMGAVLALGLTGAGIVLGLVYFEKKREVRNIINVESKERDLGSKASAQHQKHRGAVVVAEQRGRVKFQTGTQRGYVNYYEVPWSFAVLKSNMLFQFRDPQAMGCSAAIKLDGARIKVVHWIKSGGRVCSKYHRKSAIRITSSGDGSLIPGEKSIFLYFFRGYEMDEWLYALKRAAKLSNLSDEESRRLEAEHQHFMHLNTILTSGEPVAADWLNALLGRIFWGVHDNPFVLKMLKKGLQTKIDKMKKPTFPIVQVQSIVVQNVSLGPNMPVFSGIVLNSLSPQGALSFDLDVLYHGGFQLDLEIILAFTVPLTKKIVLIPVQSYTTVRCVAGRVNYRAAPPPSVKSWIGFYGLPRVDVDIRTEVGKKQSNFWLRDLPAIARVVTVKIKEKILKKIVLPTMEDFPLPAVPKKFTRQALEELAAAKKVEEDLESELRPAAATASAPLLSAEEATLAAAAVAEQAEAVQSDVSAKEAKEKETEKEKTAPLPPAFEPLRRETGVMDLHRAGSKALPPVPPPKSGSTSSIALDTPLVAPTPLAPGVERPTAREAMTRSSTLVEESDMNLAPLPRPVSTSLPETSYLREISSSKVPEESSNSVDEMDSSGEMPHSPPVMPLRADLQTYQEEAEIIRIPSTQDVEDEMMTPEPNSEPARIPAAIPKSAPLPLVRKRVHHRSMLPMSIKPLDNENE